MRAQCAPNTATNVQGHGPCAGMDLGSLSQMMGAVARKRSGHVKETAELKASFVDPKMLPGRGLVVAGRATNDEGEADSLEREVSFLQSDDVSQRRAALSRIMLLAQNPETPPGAVNRVWEAVSLELMKLMSDPAERLRDMAMRSLIAFLDRVTAVAHILPVAVPCLLHRMGSLPAEEPAEEVRLLLVLVLGRLVSLLPKNIGDYMDAIQTILVCALTDVNPAVRKEACTIIVMLCRSQREGMRKVLRVEETRAGNENRHRYEDMIKSLKSTIKHKHASVRQVAVSSLGALLMCGDKNMNAVEDLVAWHQPNVIPIWQFFAGGVYEDGKLIKPDEREVTHNYLAILGTDKSPQVREAFLHMLVDWMTRLTDRWDHEMRLLPYLINGLTDDVPKMREVAFEAMERLGATHESEKDNNERDKQELRDFREYGHKTPAEQNAAERWLTRAHEPPFTRRPRLGSRMVVRNNFRRLCPTLVRELNDWIPRTRSMSAQLLYYLALYCEYWVTNEAIQIVEAITKCIFRSLAEMETGDPEARLLLRKVLLLATTIGEFVDPSVYMPLLLPVVRGETETDIHHRCAAIEVLRALCEGCSPSWLRTHADVIVRALDCTSIWESRDPRLSTQIARCAGQLALTCGDVLVESDRVHLLRIVLGLQVKAWSFGARDVPPLQSDDDPLDHYNRTWATLQTVCTRSVEHIAASVRLSAPMFMAQQLNDAVQALMPVCSRYGLELELALLEVCVRQADVASLTARAGSFGAVVEHVRRLVGGRAIDEEPIDEWVVIDEDGAGNSCLSAAAGIEKKESNDAVLQVQVDALVFLVYLLSDPTAVEPWRENLPATLVDVLALAHRGARASITAEQRLSLQAAGVCNDAAALTATSNNEKPQQPVTPETRALARVESAGEAGPAITVVGVGIKEAPIVPSTVIGAVVCQTALEVAYLALVPELSAYVCSDDVVAAVEALALDALSLSQGTIRQLMCLVVASCAEAVRVSATEGGCAASFKAPCVLAEALLARVDDSQNDVRVEALNCLLALLVAHEGMKGRWGDLLARIEMRVTAVLENSEEEEQVCAAAEAMVGVVVAAR